MKKLLSIVLALSLVLGMLPVFAVDAAQTSGDKLKELGMLKSGDRPGDYLTRAEAAVIITQALGKFDELDAKKGTAVPATGMSDEKDFPAWAAHHIAFVISEGIFKGFPDKSFKHKNHLSAEQFATILRRILKHDNEAFGQNIQELNKLGINIQSAEQIKRGDAFDAFFTAAVLPIHNSGKSLLHVLGKEDLAIQKGFINESKPDELTIVKVEADNLKQIKVSFNQKVSKDNLGEFTVKDKDDKELEIVSKKISEDELSVVLTMAAALKEGKEYKINAKDVKAQDSNVAALVSDDKTVTPLDNVPPQILAVEFSGAKYITVTFSEPMKEGKFSDAGFSGSVKITHEKGAVSVTKLYSEVSGNKAVIKLGGSLVEDKEYTVTIENFLDAKGNKNKFYEEKLTVAKQTETPTALVTSADEKSYVVEFSDFVTGLKKDDFHHSYGSVNAFKIFFVPSKKDGAGKDIEVKDTDVVNRVKVVFYNGTTNALPGGDVKVMIDGGRIKNLWDVKLQDYKGSVNVVADVEKPVVNEVKPGSNYVKVVFSEAVKVATAGKEYDSFIVTKDGKDIYNGVVFEKENTVAKISLKNVKANDKIKVVVKNIKDESINENKMAVEHTADISLVDEVPPAVVKVTHYADTINKIYKLYVAFDEDLDSASALNIKNYKLLNGAAYTDLAGSVEFYENSNKTVVINMDKDENAEVIKGSTLLFVQNIADTKENVITSTVSTAIVGHATAYTEALDSTNPIYATGEKTVVVKFNQDLAEVDDTMFEFVEAGKTIKILDLSWEKKTVTITADQKVTPGTTTLTIKKGAVKGLFTQGDSQFAAATGKAIADNVKPTVKGMKQIAEDKIEVEFDKALAQINATANNAETAINVEEDLAVYYNGQLLKFTDADNKVTYDATTANITASKKLIITLVKYNKKAFAGNALNEDDNNGTLRVVIKDAKHLKDNAGMNAAVKDYVGTLKLDTTKPTVVDVKTAQFATDDNLVEVTFSEPLKHTAVELTAGWFQLGTKDPTSVAYKGEDKKVVVLKYSSTDYAAGNLVITADVLDASGNALKETTYTLASPGALGTTNNVWTEK